jgi:type II secretory pathway predicted ATPase ExeA
MVDERGIQPVVILDNAHHLCDRFLIDLDLFLNFAFDSRDLLTVWLVGLGSLARILHLQQHAQLAMRVAAQVHLDPLDRESFGAFVDHGLKAQEATATLLSDPAREILFRASRGVPRLASQLLRASLKRAHEREQSFVDEHVVEAAVDELAPPKVMP